MNIFVVFRLTLLKSQMKMQFISAKCNRSNWLSWIQPIYVLVKWWIIIAFSTLNHHLIAILPRISLVSRPVVHCSICDNRNRNISKSNSDRIVAGDNNQITISGRFWLHCFTHWRLLLCIWLDSCGMAYLVIKYI